MRVLHCAAEVFPLVKTGGLADVVGALPQALIEAGAEVRLVLPGLPAIADAVIQPRTVWEGGPAFGAARVRVSLATMPFTHVPVYVVHAPLFYRREGGPYHGPDGHDWCDNLVRFALLGWVGAQLTAGGLDPDWTPQILHAHDWHAAMGCAYLSAHPLLEARSVFTIHNLAYQGLFALGDFAQLGLPSRFLQPQGLEYHGQLSFMKAGLKYAQHITTVSPTYAREIATPEFGQGLDGVIRSRQAHVSGILNGVDEAVWNPATDACLAAPYSAASPMGKSTCRGELQSIAGLEPQAARPVFGVVSRLSEQKGLDLLLAALPRLLAAGAQLVLQGSGDPALEQAFRDAARAHPGRVAVRIGYDETFAHRLIAGADVILVPSRFEPCGLTQLYGLRYGTLPLVRRVGGLADTVTDASPENRDQGRATGFVFDAPTAAALGDAIDRAVALYHAPHAWQGVMRTAMAQPVGWQASALQYLRLYRDLLAGAAVGPR